MIQNREPQWRQLLPGVLLIAAMIFAAFHILTRVGLGNIPGRKFTLFARAEQARGILHGSDVWLAGSRAGSVSGVRFLPPDPGLDNRVIIEIRILEKLRDHVRRDSRAEIRPGSRLIGNPVVEISQGTPAHPPVADGDTIETASQVDAELTIATAQAALAELPAALRDLRTALDGAGLKDSLLARLFSSDSASVLTFLSHFTNTLTNLTMRFETGAFSLIAADSGALPRLRRSGLLMDSALRRLDPANSAAVRYLSASELPNRVVSVARQLDSLALVLGSRWADMRNGPRAAALATELTRLTASLKALQDDARRHPLRYIVF